MRLARMVSLGLVLILGVASSASAEWWGDFFLGAAVPSKSDVEDKNSLGLGTVTIKDVKFDSSLSIGGRVGWWTSSLPWLGVAFDVFYFTPDVGRQTRTATLNGSAAVSSLVEPIDISVVTLGLNLMGRLPLLANQEFKEGRLQPYVGVGPALFIAKVKDRGNFEPSNQSKTDSTVGLDVKAGLKFFLTSNLAIFGEYRFNHFSPDVKFRDETPPPSQERLSTTLNVHHVGGGVSFHFK